MNARSLPSHLSRAALCAVVAASSFGFPQRAGAQAADAAALLAKHRAYAGWTAGNGTLTSWRAQRSHAARHASDATAAQPAAAPRANVIEARRGSIYRITYLGLGGLEEDEGFTGRANWDSDYNANLVVHFEEQARADLSLDAVFADTVSTLPGTTRGSAKIDEAQFDIVRVTPSGGYPVDLYVGADGAYRRAVIAPDVAQRRLELDVDSYAEALPGKRVIGSYHYGAGSLYSLVSIEGNPALADTDLLPPKPRSHWTFAADNSLPVTIVHHQDFGAAAQVHASINGHVGTFLVDSGSDGTVLFRAYADSLGVDVLAPAGFSGINGRTIEASWVKVKDLALGNNVLHDVIVQKTKGGKELSGIDGILGYDVLAHALIDVDLAVGKMTILDPAQFTPAVVKGAVAFPVDLESRQPVIHVTVGSNVDAQPMFDTGDDFYVLLSDDLRSSGKIVPLQSTTEVFNGVDGSGAQSVSCSKITLISVGPIRYENSNVCFGDPKVFGSNGGLIGFDFLRHFNWTFDYPDGKLVLTPNGLN